MANNHSRPAEHIDQIEIYLAGVDSELSALSFIDEQLRPIDTARREVITEFRVRLRDLQEESVSELKRVFIEE